MMFDKSRIQNSGIAVAAVVVVTALLATSMLKFNQDTDHSDEGVSLLSTPSGEIDLGEIVSGEIRSGSITVQNQTSRAVRIEKVISDCGGTTSDLDTRDILPGATAELTIKFNSEGLNGQVRRVVRVFLEGQSVPAATFFVLADVRQNLRISRSQLRLCPVPGTGFSKGALRLFRDSGSSLDLTHISGLGDGVTYTVGRWTDVGTYEFCDITFSSDPNDRQASARTYKAVAIATDGSELPVEISYDIIPAITVEPAEVVFHSIEQQVAQVKLTWTTATPPRIRDIESLDGYVTLHDVEYREDLVLVTIRGALSAAHPHDIMSIRFSFDERLDEYRTFSIRLRRN